MPSSNYYLGELITQRREKNPGGDLPIRGVSKSGLQPPKQIDADTSIYNLYYLNDFIYNPARMELGSIAFNDEYEQAICSSLYEIFYVHRTDLVVPEYLALFVKQPEFARYCNYLGNGSAREYCRFNDISRISITLPSITEQKKIVHNNKIVTERIELLEKINKKLEECTRAVYEAFFETFDHFGGNCPGTITTTKLSDLPIEVTDYVANGSFADLNENVTLYDDVDYAYYVRNTDLKSNNYTKYVDEASYRFLSKSVLFGREVIISNVADVGSVFLCPRLEKPMTLGSNVIMLKSPNNSWSYFMYLYFKYYKGKRQIVEITTGSAQPKFNKTSFRGLTGMFPDNDVLEEFNVIVKPVFDQIDRYLAEIRLLRFLSKSYLGSVLF